MKLIIAYLFIVALAPQIAYSASNTEEGTPLTGPNLIYAKVEACNFVFQKEDTLSSDLSVESNYLYGNAVLHQCTYFKKMKEIGCNESSGKNCLTYDDWSIKNRDFKASMPRDSFINAMELILRSEIYK